MSIPKKSSATSNKGKSLALFIDHWFKLTESGSCVKTEFLAGATTFLTMAYVIFVVPDMLSQIGMDKGAVFVATCLISALATAAMGLWANYPIALAPGMGLTAYFVYGVCLGMGYTWQMAMGAVFWGGIAFILLSLLKVREWIVNNIPESLRIGITTGLGFFIALIGLKSVGIVVPNSSTIVSLGQINSFAPAMAALGFILILALAQRGINACVLISMAVVTLIALTTSKISFTGMVALPPSLSTIWNQLSLKASFQPSMIGVIFTFFFINLFDTTGTLIAVCDKAELLDKEGKMPRMSRALGVDSFSSSAGAIFGVPAITSYLESASGVAVGGRTGLTSLVTAGFFLLSLFLSPIVHMIPSYATSGALIYVAVLMASSLSRVSWSDLTESGPLLVTAIMIPLSFSVATGIAMGVITYCAVKTLTGRIKEVNISIWILAILFLIKFVYLGS